MSTARPVNSFEPNGTRRELVQLVRRIQALTLELEELRRRLATVARRTATDDLGNAA
jgi:regulator of replication initiation timing